MTVWVVLYTVLINEKTKKKPNKKKEGEAASNGHMSKHPFYPLSFYI